MRPLPRLKRRLRPGPPCPVEASASDGAAAPWAYVPPFGTTSCLYEGPWHIHVPLGPFPQATTDFRGVPACHFVLHEESSVATAIDTVLLVGSMRWCHGQQALIAVPPRLWPCCFEGRRRRQPPWRRRRPSLPQGMAQVAHGGATALRKDRTSSRRVGHPLRQRRTPSGANAAGCFSQLQCSCS